MNQSHIINRYQKKIKASNLMPKVTLNNIKKLSPPNYQGAYFFEYYNPVISLYLVYIFLKLKLSANLVSLSMSFCALLTIPLFMAGGNLKFWGISFLLFSYLLDWCDGAVARYVFKVEKISQDLIEKKKEIGMLLDSLYHMFYSIAVFVGMAFSFSVFNNKFVFNLTILASILFLTNMVIDLFLSRIKKVSHISTTKFMKGKVKYKSLGPVKIYLPIPFFLFGMETYYIYLISTAYAGIFLLNICKVVRLAGKKHGSKL